MRDDEIRCLYGRLAQGRSNAPSFERVLEELKQFGFPLWDMDEGSVRVILLNALHDAERSCNV